MGGRLMAASAEELTVLATIRDEMSAGLAKIGTEVEALSKKVDSQRVRLGQHQKTLSGHSKTLNESAKAFQNLSKITAGPLSGSLAGISNRLNLLSNTKAIGTLSALGAAGQKLGQQLNIHDKLSKLSSDVTGLVGTTAKATAGFGLLGVALAGFGVKTLAGFQQTKLGLGTLTGSPAAGNALFNQIQAQSGLFSTAALGNEAVSMLNQGTPTVAINKRLKSIQNIAAVQVNPQQALDSLVAGINSIQHTGRITTEGMDSLASAGLPMYDILSSQLGVSKLQVAQLVNQNRISAQMVLNQLDNLQGPYLARFQGGVQKATQTIGGEFNVLKNTITNDLATAATPLAAELQQQMPMVQKTVSGLINLIAPAGVKILGALIGPIANELPTAMAKLQPIMPKIEDSLSKFVAALVKLLPGLVQLGADLLPILPVMVNLAADVLPVVDAFVRLLTQSAPLRNILGGIFLTLMAYNRLSGLVGGIKALAGAFGTLAEKLAAVKTAEEGATVASIGGVAGGAATGAAGGAGAAAGGGVLAGLGTGAALAAPFALGVGILAAANAASQGTQKNINNLANTLTPANITAAQQAQAHMNVGSSGVGAPQFINGQWVTPGAGQSLTRRGQAANVTQHIVINGAGLNQAQMTQAIADANRKAYERGSSATTANGNTHSMARTGS
jgi:hypothetical protein